MIGNNTASRFSICTGILLIFCTAGISSAAPEPKKNADIKENRIVARVNGQPVYESTLTPRVHRELKKFRKYGAGRDTSSLETSLKRRALDEVIEVELIKQESRKLKIDNMDGKVAEKLREMRKRYQSEEEFKNFLKNRGRTERDVKESIRDNIYYEEYLKVNGITDPEVPEEDARKYYERNRDSFRGKEAVHASHILIRVKEDAGQDERERLREKAAGIRKKIQEGRDFAETAREYSEDGKTDLGYIERGYMPAEFEEVAFAMKEGELSEVVRTRHGYHIVKLHDLKPEGVAPFEDVKDFIIKYLQEELARRNHASLIKELKSRAEIEILLNGS